MAKRIGYERLGGLSGFAIGEGLKVENEGNGGVVLSAEVARGSVGAAFSGIASLEGDADAATIAAKVNEILSALKAL